MAFDYINEAFKRLELLDEQMFDTSLTGVNELADFMNGDSTEEVVRVIDPEASTEEDIQDSYVGKVIVNCNVCHSHVFENKEDIVIDEDNNVNVEKECPYCGQQEGFTIVGEIAPFGSSSEEPEETDETNDTDMTPVEEDPIDVSAEEDIVEVDETEEDDNKNESLTMSRASSRLIKEDFKEVSITTEDQHLEMTSDENGKVSVTTEPVQNVQESTMDAEMIVPVSDETEEEILSNNEEPVEETEEDSFDFDFDDIDEEGIDELGESYLRNVYNNVKSYKTTDVSANDHALIVEGLITFNSGVQKKTGFIFEAQDVNSKGKLRFIGQNKHFTESANAFSLVGHIDNKKLFVESLKYNYKVNESVVRGVARRK